MRSSYLSALAFLIGAGIAFGTTIAHAQDTTSSRGLVRKLSDAPIPYTKRGLPARRTSAGVRGLRTNDDRAASVRLFGPHDHVARTISPRPEVYWRWSGAQFSAGAQAQLVVSWGTTIDTIKLVTPKDTALQRIEIAPRGRALQVGTEYRLRLEVKPEPGSNGVVFDEVWIQRVADVGAEAAHAPAPGSDPVAAARHYASAGIWFDAFAILTAAARNMPEDQYLQRHWNSLVAETLRAQ